LPNLNIGSIQNGSKQLKLKTFCRSSFDQNWSESFM